MSSTTEVPFSKASDVLWNVVGRRKWVFRDAFFATLIINTLALATALFTMQVYDRVIPHTGFETLLVLGAGVMLALLFDLILKQVRSHMMDREGTQIDIELSDWFFRRAQGVRMEARPPSLGTLAAQLKGLEYLRGVFGSSSIFVVVDVPFAFFFIGVIAYLAGPLAIVPLVLVPVALLIGILSQRRVSKAIAANQGHQNEKAGMLVEAIDGVENIKATGNDAAIAGAWQELLDKAGADDDRIKAASAMSSNVTATLQQISYVLLIAFGAVLAVRGELSMGALIACAIISQRALSPIARFPSVLVQWEHARAALRNLDQLLSLPNEQDEHDRNLAPEVLDNSLKLDRVQFAYGDNDHLAIDIPKLEIAPGESVAIVGAVGSGKSTLLKVASGLFRPREGHVYLGGLDVAHIRTDCLRERIAYLPQDLRLTHGTLRQNLLRGIPDPGDEAILEAVRKTGLIDLINGHPLGLALPITEGGRGISGGQRQLIGITRLLLVDPGVLLLDEPSAAMDATTEARVIQLLKSMGEQGRTIVVSTHKGTLLPLVDRVVVFANGRIVTDGPRQQVMAELARKRSQGVSTEERKAV